MKIIRPVFFLIILLSALFTLFLFSKNSNTVLVEDNNSADKEQLGSYEDANNKFFVNYPLGYTVDDSYKYQNLGPGKDIAGVKFIIPKSIAEGKNLSSYDTGVSVEWLSDEKDCNAGLFLDNNTKPQTMKDGDKEYSFSMTNGAAAGNLYEDLVFAVPGTDPCIAVRYLIHSTNIGNYEPGAVQEYDRAGLLAEFDNIRRSLKILK